MYKQKRFLDIAKLRGRYVQSFQGGFSLILNVQLNIVERKEKYQNAEKYHI